MVFIKKHLLFIVLAMLALALTSCGSLPGSSSDTTDTELPVNDEGEIVEPPRVVSPNPYLESAPRISNEVAVTFDRGLTAMENEDWTEAELIFQELTVTQPKLSGPWVNLGVIHHQAGDPEAAESDWKKALEVNSLNFDAYNFLAILKREQGDFAAAETIFLNSLAKWPDNAEAHCNLGILYDLYMGLWPKALAEYQECADLTEEPSRQLRGWIIDMERRIQAQATE